MVKANLPSKEDPSVLVEQDKVILNKISGIAKPGEICAIMGESGAGKTSLLNILSFQMKNSAATRITGDIKINGQEYNHENFSRIGVYVMQDDILMDTLTVEEVLMFAAKLKL